MFVRMPARRFWVMTHRWAGLTIALFLMVAGVTGTLLAFYEELDAVFARSLHHAEPPAPAAPMMSPMVLRQHMLDLHPDGVINYLPLHWRPGRSVRLHVERIESGTGALVAWSNDWDELFVDPYTGRVLGHRQWGELGEGLVNLMPFVYRLHYSLALGDYGLLALGVAALVWTLDSFIGFYLTLPLRLRRSRGRQGRPGKWSARWKPSWFVRWHAPSKLTFDLHRAGGLWMWPLLLLFAWSSVSFNLASVYEPVMKPFGYERIGERLVPLATPRHRPVLDFATAARVGEQWAKAETTRRNLSMDPDRARGLYHRPDAGIYSYIFSSSADFRDEGGRSLAIFDSNTGDLVTLVLPQGQGGAFTFTEWITALHMAAVWGLPWTIVVGLSGMMVTVLSATGVLIWARKRSARSARPRGRGRPFRLISSAQRDPP